MIIPDHILRRLGPSLLTPFDENWVQPASIDVHLDRYFIPGAPEEAFAWNAKVLDPRQPVNKHFEPFVEVDFGKTFVLDSDAFALGSTFQRISLPNHIVARFEGKSSLGRLGLLTHVTAGFIDPGFVGHITVELKNVSHSHIRLYPGMKIGQVCFEDMGMPVERPYGHSSYGSHYQGQRGPTLSRIHQGFSTIDVYDDKVEDDIEKKEVENVTAN